MQKNLALEAAKGFIRSALHPAEVWSEASPLLISDHNVWITVATISASAIQLANSYRPDCGA